MPFKLLYAFSSFISWLILHINRIPSNEIAQRNLRRAFPEKSPKEIKDLCQKYYSSFCDYLIEFVKATRFSNKEMMTHCQFRNVELLKEKFQNHQFIICYGGHLLNFEWQVSLPLHIKGYGMCHLYLSGEKSREMKWILNKRSRYGAVNIPTASPLKPLVSLKNNMDKGIDIHKGYIFGTLADMDTTEEHPHISTFFNHDLEMFTGSERIGKKMNMAFVYAEISRPKRGYYIVEFKEIMPKDKDTNPYAYTDEFASLLEKNIRKQPELWMQWGECRF